jgi:hypothetical protein
VAVDVLLFDGRDLVSWCLDRSEDSSLSLGRNHSEDVSSVAKAVGLYKTFQSTGGAVAWRINALGYAPLTQFAINWGLIGGALLCAIPAVWSITPVPPPTYGLSTSEQKEKEAAPGQ